MASYLRSWLPSSLPLSSSSLAPEPESSTTPTAPTIELAEDDDAPPAFPALDSAQRTSIPEKSGTPHILSDDALMPPPPVPPVGRLSQLGAPSSLSGGSLMPPPSTNKAPTRSPAQKKREKVALAPGHSPLDWANLKNSGADLRAGATQLMRIPPSVLKQHNKRGDAWSAFNGKVYNITPYIDFHPGGAKELMRVAGRDGTKLFALTHSWVNLDYMLDACLVGFLVPEPSS